MEDDGRGDSVPGVPELSIVIPTLGRHETLSRVLDRLARQSSPACFEVLVVADAAEPDPGRLDRLAADRPYPLRRLAGSRPGASAARNAGIEAAAAALVLFLDDDVMPQSQLVAEHISRHADHPDEEVGVLGLVRWADELRVTPFMRWLERGVHFDFAGIDGEEAGWGRFYTANASLKRSMLERVGGFDEERLPFGYEDLDLAYRMHAHGFRLLFNPRAVGEHLHEMTLDSLRERAPRMAESERAFCAKHPEIPPYFLELFRAAASAPPAHGRLARLARFVPPGVPLLGPRVWGSVDARFKQALAPDFLRAWDATAEPVQR